MIGLLFYSQKFFKFWSIIWLNAIYSTRISHKKIDSNNKKDCKKIYVSYQKSVSPIS